MEYSKRPVTQLSDGVYRTPWTSKWHYFNQLLFLKDIVTPRKCSNSVSSKLGTNSSSNDLALDEVDVEDTHLGFRVSEPPSPAESVDPEPTNTTKVHVNDATDSIVSGASSNTSSASLQSPPSPPPAKKGRKRKWDSFIDHCEKQFVLEQQKLKLLSDGYCCRDETKDDDDDLLFLKSLLPYIKRIPMDMKMTFRSRVQLLVDEYTSKKQIHSNVI